MAAGSQIIINKNGITFITPAKFEAKAGQHKFQNGDLITFSTPKIPQLGLNYLKFNVTDKNGFPLASGTTYSLLHPNGQLECGTLPEDGVIETPPSDQAEEYILIIDNEKLTNNLIGDE